LGEGDQIDRTERSLHAGLIRTDRRKGGTKELGTPGNEELELQCVLEVRRRKKMLGGEKTKSGIANNSKKSHETDLTEERGAA